MIRNRRISRFIALLSAALFILQSPEEVLAYGPSGMTGAIQADSTVIPDPEQESSYSFGESGIKLLVGDTSASEEELLGIADRSGSLFLRQKNSVPDSYYYGLLTEDERALYDIIPDILELEQCNISNIDNYTFSSSKIDELVRSGSMTSLRLKRPYSKDGLSAIYTNAAYAYIFEHPLDVKEDILLGRCFGISTGAVAVFGIRKTENMDFDEMRRQVEEKKKQILIEIRADKDYREDDAVKELLVHDYVCSHVRYDNDCVNERSEHRVMIGHNIYGAMVENNAVCDAISMMTSLLLNELGVETYILGSRSHAWNLVKLSDGYYETDCTWDLSGGSQYIPHSYFNLTTEKMTLTGSTMHKRGSMYAKMPTAPGTLYSYDTIRSIIDRSEKPPVYSEGRVTAGGITYKTFRDGTASCTGASNSVKKLVIPEKVSSQGLEYTVTSIADKAFAKNARITTVTIPGTVESIGTKAFIKCRGIKKIKIADASSITMIGAKAFKGLSGNAVFLITGDSEYYEKLCILLSEAGAGDIRVKNK